MLCVPNFLLKTFLPDAELEELKVTLSCQEFGWARPFHSLLVISPPSLVCDVQ